MYSIILPHLKQRRKISFDISPLLYALHQPIISMDMDHGSQLRFFGAVFGFVFCCFCFDIKILTATGRWNPH